jgi:intracellular sulfur oxidation DsrE/DsrF family protein
MRFALLLAASVFGAMIFAAAASAGETKLADPPPSFDNPRKVMLTLADNDPAHVNNVLYNVVNIQKFYGMDNVQVVVIAYGPGVRAFLKESSPVPERVQSLEKYDVEFVACGSTLDAMHKHKSDLLDGIDVVQAGIPEIVERKLNGWVYVHP